MLIACPNCSTRYNIDPGIVGAGGRKVRCSQCGNVWIQKLPDEDQPDAAEDYAAAGQGRIEFGEDEFGDEARDAGPATKPTAPPARRGRASPAPVQDEADFDPDDLDEEEASAGSRFPMFWLGAIAVLMLLGVAVFVFKDQISEMLPATAELYAAIGLENRPPGEVWQIRTKPLEPDPTRDGNIVVAGEVYNTADEDLQIPRMRAIIKDGQGNEVQSWEFSADSVIVLGGDKTTFRTSFRQHPEGQQLEITFVDD